MISILLKDLHKNISTEKYIEILSELFRNGMALDLVDITNEDSYISNASSSALSCIDLEELFENSELLEIEEKYPDFYKFLREWYFEHHRDHDEGEKTLGDEDVELEEKTDELTEENERVNGSIIKNLIEGEHTGDQRFSEKYVKGDKARDELTQEYNEKMKSSKFVQDSYEAVGHKEANTKKREFAQEDADLSESLKDKETQLSTDSEEKPKSTTVLVRQKVNKKTLKKSSKTIAGSTELESGIIHEERKVKDGISLDKSDKNLSSESDTSDLGSDDNHISEYGQDKLLLATQMQDGLIEEPVSRDEKDIHQNKPENISESSKYISDSYEAVGITESDESTNQVLEKSEQPTNIKDTVAKSTDSLAVIGKTRHDNDEVKDDNTSKLFQRNADINPIKDNVKDVQIPPGLIGKTQPDNDEGKVDNASKLFQKNASTTSRKDNVQEVPIPQVELWDDTLESNKYVQDSYETARTPAVEERTHLENRLFEKTGQPTDVKDIVAKSTDSQVVIGKVRYDNGNLKVTNAPRLSKNNVINPRIAETFRFNPIERKYIQDSYESIPSEVYDKREPQHRDTFAKRDTKSQVLKADNFIQDHEIPTDINTIFHNNTVGVRTVLTAQDIIKSGAAKDLNLTEQELTLFSNVSGYIPDSYEQSDLSFGFKPIQNETINNEKFNSQKVNVGIVSRQTGNIVPVVVNGRAKQFTIRSDNTININGVLMNVYKLDDYGKVFIGWKDSVLTNEHVLTPTGLKFKIDNHIVQSDFGVALEIDKKKISDKINVNTFSMAPTIIALPITGNDFKNCDSLFMTKGYERNNQSCLTNHNLDYKNMTQALVSQNKQRYITTKTKALQSIVEFAECIPTANLKYDDIVKEVCSNNRKIKASELNKYLEKAYLDDSDIARLAVSREKLREFKKEGVTEEIQGLQNLLNTSSISKEARAASEEYIKIYNETRLKIINQNLDGIKSGNIEITSKDYKLFEATASTEEKEILNQIGHKDVLSVLNDPLASQDTQDYLRKSLEYKKADKTLKRLYRMKSIMNAAKNVASGVAVTSANAVKKSYRKGKQYASRYMSDDYTMRGLLILTAVIVEAPLKAYSTVKKARSIAKSTVKLTKSTVRASKALGKTAISFGKAGAKGYKYVAKHGAKKAAKTAVKVIGNSKVRRAVTKQAVILTKKAAITIVRVIIKILTTIVTTLLSILGPLVLMLLVVIILIFSIFAFINNSGDEVYYDAGDEDTTEVVQEMNDLLTLCHASFRSQLSGHSGIGGGMIGGSVSGTDGSTLNAPQMKKGDSSAVSGLYDVTAGTWWNYEFSWDYISGRWASGTRQAALGNMIDSGQLKAGNNGGYLFLDDKLYVAAFGSYWGQVGDVLKVEFNNVFQIGTQPATNTMYIVKADEKAWKDTGYPEQPEGIYGHPFGGHRDFAEFIGASGVTSSSSMNLNNKGLLPVKCTNLGNVLDGTFDVSQLSPGAGGMSTSVSSNADIFYRQEIDQEVYREILDRNKNVYMTFPKDQEVPDGITPTPMPENYDPQNSEGEVYSFYNNNQELISMVLAMFDFDINSSTSAKQTTILTADKSGTDDEAAEEANQKGMTNKINDDTWRLITYFDEFGLDLETYNEGGYDDLKYSTLVGLFNASHIVTDTPVLQYHEGPDGTINPVYDDNGKIIGQNNTDGHSYQVPVIITEVVQVENPDGSISHEVRTSYKTDENGNIVYETKYDPCLGHRKDSIAVITLHFDSLLHIKDWWNENIYSVDDFDKENPNYSSNNKDDENYKAKETTLKRQFQFIMKPDFYKPLPGTCSESNQSNSEFNAGTMTEDQKAVANKCYQYFVGTMGLTHEQAIGVLVNIKRECDFDYTLVENGGGGYGLVQWTGGRRTKLMEYCNSHPETGAYNTLEGQLAFLNAEFTIYKDVWTGQGVDGFKRCKTEREAGEYFIRYFERPREDLLNQRIQEMDSDIAAVKAMLS